MGVTVTCDRCSKADTPADPVFHVIVRSTAGGPNLGEADLCSEHFAYTPVPQEWIADRVAAVEREQAEAASSAKTPDQAGGGDT